MARRRGRQKRKETNASSSSNAIPVEHLLRVLEVFVVVVVVVVVVVYASSWTFSKMQFLFVTLFFSEVPLFFFLSSSAR